ncbi:hypothetical protein A6V39_01030 [Candidatus Mycoplasma haematobovis]|uniref:Uncharacterized protein n=1 Tax=Candidatus Mycoplasma haematobovis TaxID=432608 RepID=A0A1A9QFA9_9MOLU|nr:hypothetical protein [Candidatus Mycoplasma haematobovis]OAL10636.1 hypothetical protein A6V39_01030 [Candidatus Mycoplasma haematobovis]
MIPLQISTPPLKAGFYSSLLKPVFLLGVSGISSVGLTSTLSSSNNLAKSMVDDIVKKVGEQESIKKLGTGISELFETLEDWLKKVVNKSSEWRDKLKDYAKINEIPTGAKMMLSKLGTWSGQVWDVIKQYVPEIAKINWEKIRSLIAQYGDKAVNLLSLLKNIFDSKGGDTLLITKLFEAINNEKFGEFASAMGGLIQKKPEAFNDLNSDDVGKIFDAFNGDEQGTVETLQKLEQKEGKLDKDQLMGALNKGSLMWRAKHYLGRAKEFEEQKRTGKPIDQGELKSVIENLKKVMQEIETIKQQHKSK